jgi:leucyl aminopeptidase
MKLKLSTKPLDRIDADIEIVLVIAKAFDHPFVKPYADVLERAGFTGGQDSVCHLPEKRVVVAGADSLKSTDVRPAVASALRALAGTPYTSAKIATYMSHPKCTATLRALVEGAVLGAYTFDRYKSDTSTDPLRKLIVSTADEYSDYTVDFESAKRTVTKGLVAAEATNFTRDIVNTPPDDFYPKIMAKAAMKLAKDHRLNVTVLGPKELKKEKMNALLSVARASRHKPRLIHLAYTPPNPVATVSIVGKGLTYDSGGLSLKPADFMVTMKSDKSGGAAVLGVLKAVSELQLPVEVHGFIGAVENMIGGDAYKPDDVLTAKNGKTIEVRNTDAEGRLVLADVLSYAQEKVRADYLFDLATLTGACVVGVGQYTNGVMSFAKEPAERVLYAANTLAGENATQLHFNRHLRKTIESKIADVCNVANTRYGGAITAGLFLGEFIDEHHRDRWAHIDIAGPAYVESPWGENPHGASGAGVRLMIHLIEKLARGEGH